MRRPFYHYLMTIRDPHKKDAITLFANAVYLDDGFPKQSEDYQEISHYLELNGDYLAEMTTFDLAWERYVDRNKE
ncbi:MAG: YozE family protein [Carnobacterium sp.]|uniref:YozE family protein n=1 Tax=Carnobacterium sp. TaxID=48221 RepID=UPI002FC8DB47